MSKSAKPLWPDPMGLPFGLFGASPPPAPEPVAASPMTQAFMQPFAQGLAGGVDMVKQFLGSLPGGTSVPGFLLPTVDVEEIDKRISDLRAAESWLDVNLNMLRATIQGLEVQRHTIAAIRSLGAMPDMPPAPKAAAPAPSPAPMASPTPSGLPPGWPVSRKAAEVEPEPEEEAIEEPEEPEEEAEPEPTPPPRVAKKSRKRPAAKSSSPEKSAAAEAPANTINNMVASNWLGYMQDQFTKVAQAALASAPKAVKAVEAAPPPAAKAARKAVRKGKAPAKKARRKA